MKVSQLLILLGLIISAAVLRVWFAPLAAQSSCSNTDEGNRLKSTGDKSEPTSWSVRWS